MLGKNLRGRVFAACILISIAPLSVVTYQGYHCGRMALMDLTYLHVLSIAEARQGMIATWLGERADDISAVVSLPVVVSQVDLLNRAQDPAATEVLTGILRATQSHGDVFDSLVVFDVDWNVLAESEKGLHANGKITTTDFQEQVRNATGVYSGEAHLHDDHEVGCHVGSSIRAPSGEIVGFLVANLNITASLTPLLQDRSGLWRTGKAYIVDSDNRILTEPFEGGERYAFSNLSEAAKHGWRASKGDGHNVHVYSDFLANEVIGEVLPVDTYGWAVVVEIDTDESNAWVRVLLFRSTFVFIAALLTVILVSVWLSRLLGSPLTQLAAVTHRISEGHTDERLGAMALEEAEEVRCAFNRMLDELRNKEQEIVRSTTLAMIGELTSRVVHEMRNPLSSVKMNFQALQRSVEQTQENVELAEIALGQLLRLEKMLNELLQYGRPLEFSWECVNVGSLIKAAVDELEELSSEKRVEVNATVGADIGEIEVDVEQFKRVLVNLIRNAIEASPGDSGVEIHVRTSGGAAPDTVIDVIDMGGGIREEHLDMLFKPFFTTKSEGIGLGLANVKKIVGLHFGHIRVRNGHPCGAVFTITIPRQSPSKGTHLNS